LQDEGNPAFPHENFHAAFSCVLFFIAQKTQAGPDVRLINLLFSAKIAFCVIKRISFPVHIPLLKSRILRNEKGTMRSFLHTFFVNRRS
jgi:hypothetical protein